MSLNPTPKPYRAAVPPAQPPQFAAGGVVDAALAEYRYRLALHEFVGRLLAVCGLGGLALLAAIVADHVWSGGLPRIALVVISVAWSLALLLGCAAAILLTLGRRLNPLFVAQQLERASRIRTNSLINALLLRRNATHAYAGDAVLSQAARDLESQPSARLVGVRTNRRPAVLLAAAAAAWLAYISFAPKPVGPSLARVFGGGGSAPTATRLELLEPGPGDIVHVGDAVGLVVAVHGKAVERVQLALLTAAGADSPARTQTAYTRSDREGRLVARFSVAPFEVRGDLQYRLTAGDARLAGVIPVHPRPETETIEVVIEPPAYTGRPPRPAGGPDLDVLYGSNGVFRLEANVEIREPVFVLESDRQTRTRMRVDPANPRAARVKRLLTESGQYSIDFADRWGYPHRQPPRHRITVREDEPPSVAFAVPPEDAGDVVDVRKVPELLVVAKDDVGVARLVLVTDRDSGREETILHAETPATGRRAVKRIATCDLPIAPGETLRAWCTAADARMTLDGRADYQTARTRTLTLVYSAPEQAAAAPAGDPEADRGGQDDAEDPDAPGRSGEEGDEQGSGAPEEAGIRTDGLAEGDGPDSSSDSTASDTASAGRARGEGESAGEADSEPELDRELDEFVRRHGRDASEAAKGLRENESAQESADAAQPAQRGGDAEAGESPTETPSDDTDGATPAGETPQPEAAGPAGADASNSTGQSEPEEAGRGDAEAAEADDPHVGDAVAGDPPPGSPSEGETAQPTAGASQRDAAGEAPPGPPGERDRPVPDGSASAAEREDVPGDQPQTEKQESDADLSQPPAATPRSDTAPLDTEGLADTIDLLEMLERGERIDEERLIALGWSRPRAAAFARALERLHRAAQAAARGEPLRQYFDAEVGSLERQEGAGMASDATRSLDADLARREGLERIAPPPEQEVPHALRDVLDAYYQSLAGRRAAEGG